MDGQVRWLTLTVRDLTATQPPPNEGVAAALTATMQITENAPARVPVARGLAHRRYPMDTPEDRPAPRRFTAAEKAEMVHLYTTPLPDGTWMGATTIARRLGTNHRSVYYVLKQAGVPTRDAREAHAHGKVCKPVKNLPTGQTPSCKCGCGAKVDWNQRKNRWNKFADGHYRGDALYKDAAWLREQYVTRNRTSDEIAEECDVAGTTILRWLDRFEIPRRNPSDARIGRQAGERNPAWKGGIAKWPYAAEWKRIAREIRGRDEWTCQLCHEQRPYWGINLHVHHIDGDKLNNDRLNLISVCASCHPRGPKETALAPTLRQIAAEREGVIS